MQNSFEVTRITNHVVACHDYSWGKWQWMGEQETERDKIQMNDTLTIDSKLSSNTDYCYKSLEY